jgi:glycerol-3-phosphate cytidylyltransferase/D-beta-D-heptose 7-phosphate kinase/D-beta-D-heptose 1-phosphate adenosyltransferase
MDKRVCASGYFNPLHIGHIEYLSRAKQLAGPGGVLVVIVNNDAQSFLKKGSSFMPERERVAIVSALRAVDEVVLSMDEDRTVCRTLASIHPRITHFCNGGDQTNDTIPEKTVCDSLGIELVDGLGDKIQSSSWLIAGKKKVE